MELGREKKGIKGNTKGWEHQAKEKYVKRGTIGKRKEEHKDKLKNKRNELRKVQTDKIDK